MKPTLCSRCKKNLAVVFITKIDGGKTVNEGLCLKCAKEMGIKPVDDMIERMGLSEDDLENLNGEMTEAMNGLESLLSQGHDAEDGSEDLEGDNAHTEAGYSGTIDLYTKTEDDPLTAAIRGVLDRLECAWYLNSVQYEAETGLLHYEWVWGLV